MDASDDRWAAADSVFERALAAPPERRSAVVAEACGGDDELRALVERLLRYAASGDHTPLRPGGALDGPIARRLADELGPQDRRLAEGTMVGAYQIVGEIGRGGMSAVYLAERAGAEFTQRVAVKVIQSGIDGTEAAERFALERQILADARHPDIARLIDGGVTEDGRHYLVMELVERRADRRALRRAAAAGGGPVAAHPAHRPRRGIGPPQPGRPPRHQAVERAGHARWQRQAARLRHRQAARSRLLAAPDTDRSGADDPRLRRAGAGPRGAGDDRDGRLPARGAGLRRAHRGQPARRPRRRLPRLRAGGRGAAAGPALGCPSPLGRHRRPRRVLPHDPRAPAPAPRRRSRGSRHARPREATPGPLRLHGRLRLRPGGRARRPGGDRPPVHGDLPPPPVRTPQRGRCRRRRGPARRPGGMDRDDRGAGPAGGCRGRPRQPGGDDRPPRLRLHDPAVRRGRSRARAGRRGADPRGPRAWPRPALHRARRRARRARPAAAHPRRGLPQARCCSTTRSRSIARRSSCARHTLVRTSRRRCSRSTRSRPSSFGPRSLRRGARALRALRRVEPANPRRGPPRHPGHPEQPGGPRAAASATRPWRRSASRSSWRRDAGRSGRSTATPCRRW